MSYLKFDKNLMINLEESLPREMLRTNQSGAYHCTTTPENNTGCSSYPFRNSTTTAMYCSLRSTRP